MKNAIATLSLILIAALALAAPAAGQGFSPTKDQYRNSADGVGAGVGGDPGDPSATADPSSTGSLPFTGLDLALMGAAAAGLVGAGVVIRRRATLEESS